MRFKLTITLTIAAVAFAQYPTLPECADSVLDINNSPNIPGCLNTDAVCICKNSVWTDYLNDQLPKSCTNENDLMQAEAWVVTVCSHDGVDLSQVFKVSPTAAVPTSLSTASTNSSTSSVTTSRTSSNFSSPATSAVSVVSTHIATASPSSVPQADTALPTSTKIALGVTIPLVVILLAVLIMSMIVIKRQRNKKAQEPQRESPYGIAIENEHNSYGIAIVNKQNNYDVANKIGDETRSHKGG